MSVFLIIFVIMQEYFIYNTLEKIEDLAAQHRSYHIHLLCRGGEMTFLLGDRPHKVSAGDLLIWQMTSEFSDLAFTEDFDADVLLVSNHFLSLYNPEQVWATKGYVYIKNNPVFHLDTDSWVLMENDFQAFRLRTGNPPILFRDEIIGEMFRIFLYDMWNIYSREIEKDEIEDIASRHFLRFLMLVQAECVQQREVSYYAGKLNLAPKYLSEISKNISGKPASEWIQFYTGHELVKLLSDKSLTLTDITDRMGFSSQAMLTRYLKRTYGMTPSEFRKR